MLHPIERIPFPELGITDPDALRRWAAIALFESEVPTADLPWATTSLQIRPTVRTVAWSLTEHERAELLHTEYGAYPTEAAARAKARAKAVQDAPAWILMDRWMVAR
ncbi:hypothetical protein [Kitasatospora sp. KL5]|uniref:hypothetical protein n=1 Tax=Kitasatospora sp. KL5 TaxID=3425125 RepID=UPI003D6FE256